MRLDVDALLLGHVDHVQAHHDRLRQGQKLGHQVEVALELCGVDDGDHHVGAFPDHVVAGDAFFFRVGGETVSAGEVDEVRYVAVVAANPRLLFDGLAGPVAHVLAQTRQHVEDRGFAHVRLAGEGDRHQAAIDGQAGQGIVTGCDGHDAPA